MNYAESIAKHHREVAAQELEKNNRKVWQVILSQYTLSGCDANYKEILAYSGGEITIPKFEWMLQHDPQKLVLTDDRELLTERILKLLEDPTKHRMSDNGLAMWRTKLKHMTTPELRAKLTEIATRQAMNELPVGELRSALADFRKSEELSKRTPDGYERIPATVEFNQVTLPIRDYLNKIVKDSNITLIKKAVLRWGNKQFDAVRRGY